MLFRSQTKMRCHIVVELFIAVELYQQDRLFRVKVSGSNHCSTMLIIQCVFIIWLPIQISKIMVHCSLSSMMHAPFHASMLRPASQAGLMHETAEVGKLVNAVLLSLINEACVNVCCTTLLSSEFVGPACVQARSSNPRGRACRPSGKGSGEEGILSDVVPVYLYCPAFSVSVSLGV